MPLFCHCLEGQGRAQGFQGEWEGICEAALTRGKQKGSRVEGWASSRILKTARRGRLGKPGVKTGETCHSLCFPEQLPEVEPAVEEPRASPAQRGDSTLTGDFDCG